MATHHNGMYIAIVADRMVKKTRLTYSTIKEKRHLIR